MWAPPLGPAPVVSWRRPPGVRTQALLLASLACLYSLVGGSSVVSNTRALQQAQELEIEAAVNDLFENEGRKLLCGCHHPGYGPYSPTYPVYPPSYPPPPDSYRRRALSSDGSSSAASQLEAMRTRLLKDGWDGAASSRNGKAAGGAPASGAAGAAVALPAVSSVSAAVGGGGSSVRTRMRSLLEAVEPQAASARKLLDCYVSPPYYPVYPSYPPPYPPPPPGLVGSGGAKELAVRHLLMTDGFDGADEADDGLSGVRRSLLTGSGMNNGGGCYGPYYPAYPSYPPPAAGEDSYMPPEPAPKRRRALAQTERAAQRVLREARQTEAFVAVKKGPAYPATWSATILKRLGGSASHARRLTASSMNDMYASPAPPSGYYPPPYYGPGYPGCGRALLGFEALVAEVQA